LLAPPALFRLASPAFWPTPFWLDSNGLSTISACSTALSLVAAEASLTKMHLAFAGVGADPGMVIGSGRFEITVWVLSDNGNLFDLNYLALLKRNRPSPVILFGKSGRIFDPFS
jgi:hypothetical protein